jgi:hypothetical protein
VFIESCQVIVGDLFFPGRDNRVLVYHCFHGIKIRKGFLMNSKQIITWQVQKHGIKMFCPAHLWATRLKLL